MCLREVKRPIVWIREAVEVQVSFGGFVYSWARQLVLFESCRKYCESNHPHSRPNVCRVGRLPGFKKVKGVKH